MSARRHAAMREGTACTEEVRSAAAVTLSATPDPGSVFSGWSGGGCSGTGDCTVRMTQARSVSASFERLLEVSTPADGAAGRTGADASKSRGSVGHVRTRPKLRKLHIKIKRKGHFGAKGLSICPYAEIHPATTHSALKNCRETLVGLGSFSAEIALRGRDGKSHETAGRLLIFNGRRKGRPVLLTRIQMRHSRRFGLKGVHRTYVFAVCAAPRKFPLVTLRLAARAALSAIGAGWRISQVKRNCSTSR